MRAKQWIGTGLIVLGGGIAANSLLGPLVADVIDYHITTLLRNQTIGLDAVSLAVVAPRSASSPASSSSAGTRPGRC